MALSLVVSKKRLPKWVDCETVQHEILSYGVWAFSFYLERPHHDCNFPIPVHKIVHLHIGNARWVRLNGGWLENG